jgi:prepilin-type N-terminal cleavage/methylation domain-containing protein
MKSVNLDTPSGRATLRRGITLIEMLVVIVLIGILAGITVSRLDSTRYRADAVARGLMGDLSQAQRTAVTVQNDVRVTQVSPTRLSIHEDRNNNGAVDGGERVLFSNLDHGFQLGRGGMAALPAPAAATELTTVTFRRDGTASASGAFYLRSPGPDPLCRYCRAIELTRATGRAVYYSLATQAWVRGN